MHIQTCLQSERFVNSHCLHAWMIIITYPFTIHTFKKILAVKKRVVKLIENKSFSKCCWNATTHHLGMINIFNLYTQLRYIHIIGYSFWVDWCLSLPYTLDLSIISIPQTDLTISISKSVYIILQITYQMMQLGIYKHMKDTNW